MSRPKATARLAFTTSPYAIRMAPPSASHAQADRSKPWRIAASPPISRRAARTKTGRVAMVPPTRRRPAATSGLPVGRHSALAVRLVARVFDRATAPRYRAPPSGPESQFAGHPEAVGNDQHERNADEQSESHVSKSNACTTGAVSCTWRVLAGKPPSIVQRAIG